MSTPKHAALVDPLNARSPQKFEATSRFIRDLIAHRWVKTRPDRDRAAPKRIHYLSMEFLLGRTLLVPAGQEVTSSLMIRLGSIADRGGVAEPFRVRVAV